jgi:hypothetical protein
MRQALRRALVADGVHIGANGRVRNRASKPSSGQERRAASDDSAGEEPTRKKGS